MVVKPISVNAKKKDRPRLTNYLPWSTIFRFVKEPSKVEIGIVLQKDSCLQQTFAFRGQDLEGLSDSYVNQTFVYFNEVIKRLDDSWMVSVEAQRYATQDYPEARVENLAAFLVEKERQKSFQEYGEHFESSYYITFVKKLDRELKEKTKTLFLKDTRPLKPLRDEIQDFLKVTENATDVLQEKMVIRPLTVYETILYLRSTISFSKTRIVEMDNIPFLDTFISDSELETGTTLRLGKHYIPIATIKDFPMRTYPLIFNQLNKLFIEYRWVTRFFPMSKPQAVKELEKWQKNHFAGRKNLKQYIAELTMNIESQRENMGAVAKQGEVESAQVDVETDLVGLGYYNSSIMVYDEDYIQAMEKFKFVTATINKCGFQTVEEKTSDISPFLGMVAGDPYNNIRRPLVNTANFAHALPLSAIWSGLLENKFTNEVCGVDKPLITCSTNSGTPFFFNLNEGDVGHTIMFGPTGAGKSTHLNLLEVSFLKYPGAQVFILDKGKSALTLTLAVGGEYINPAVDDMSFQPLADLETQEDKIWAIEFIETLLYLQGVQVTARMTNAISQTIDMMADPTFPKRSRTLTSFVMNCAYQDDTGQNIIDEAIQPYTLKGAYGKIFDGEETKISDSSWIMLEMETLMESTNSASKEKVIAPAILYIFKFLQKRFTGRLTLLVLDEAWVFLEHPIFENKMKEWLKTLRKKNVFCVFATQEVADAAGSKIASTIIQNCPTKIFLADPKAEELKEGYRAFGLTDEEIYLLSCARKKRDYYYKSTLGARMYQLELGVLQLALFRQQSEMIRFCTGEVDRWSRYCEMLLRKRKREEVITGKVLEILEAQGVAYRDYLEGVKIEEN